MTEKLFIETMTEDNINNISNDIKELTIESVEFDITNLPITLDKLIIRNTNYQSLRNNLIKENMYIIINYNIRLPFGCKIYEYNIDTKEEIEINNFCGFIQRKYYKFNNYNNYNILKIMSGMRGLAYSS